MLLAVGCLLLSVTVAVLLFAVSPKLVKAQSIAAPETASDAFVFDEYKRQDGVCLTEEKRAELLEQVQSSINKLRGEGKIAAISSSSPPKFILPVRGNGAGEKDFGFHVMGNFVDHNPSFPNQLLDYNCGTRTYDTDAGYNHKGVDIINYPFAWNKMDNNETVAVAAADGQIIFKQDGNFDRSCTWNTTTTWNIVGLRHSDGTLSYYGHLKLNSLTAKAVGEMVTQGEFLGVIGSSGVSTVPHLHFEVYNADNKLQDPYQGTCNSMNNFSYWLVQPAYRDSAINKLMTHSAQPVGQPCPNPTITNEKSVFAPGSQVFVSASYRDPVAGQQSQFSLIQPDGTVNQSWTYVIPNTSPGVSLGFLRLLPVNAMTGVWKFRVVYESKTYEHTFLVRSTPFDFDGDGKSDISVFRNGTWYINRSQLGFTGINWGFATDIPAPADFDGDGKTDVSVYRDGNWYWINSSTNQFNSVQFGQNGDIPVPADFDADDKADISVFRPTNGTWYRLNSAQNNQFFAAQFGISGDKPLIGDFDGDGRADLAVTRATNGTLNWYWINSSTNQFEALQFGFSTDIATPADYDGDGKTDVSVFRPSNGTWYRLNSAQNRQFTGVQFGLNGDLPVPADYDGDGKADVAVFRTGVWYRLNSSNNSFYGEQFGIITDKPIPNAFVR